MESKKSDNSKSAFNNLGFRKTIEAHIAEIQKIYAEDQIPWVVGYSGGKDSTATLQLVWLAIAQLPAKAKKKPIFVITTDTQVENPIVAAWVSNSLMSMEQAALKAGIPIYPHKLTPDIKDTFWVNLIGRGYPAPRPKFRWCTERLKIKPADNFINNVVQQNGEAIVVLGTRKAESSVRAGRLNELESKRPRDNLSQHSSLPNAYVYAPIAEWTNDDVWLFLMQVRNPWSYDNKDLLTLYQGASPDAECPLVIDTSTPSCGDSRFGCWVCTLVEQDKSMTAMIQNDSDKAWMEPLLALRNDLDEHDHDKRDFRRMTGAVMLNNNSDKHIPGPYTQQSREAWLRRLLEAQQSVRRNPKTPEALREIELISLDELQEIRRIWVVDKYEIEDTLPEIYEDIVGATYPFGPIDGTQPFGKAEMEILRGISEGDQLHFELLRELLEVERQYRNMARRAKLFDRIEIAFKRNFFEDVEDATNRAKLKRDLDELIEKAKSPELPLGEASAMVRSALNQISPSENN